MTASAAPVELPLPRKIGRYTLFDRIGRGGMADIFLAHARTDLGISRLVVVKQILSHLAASREFSELLITEAKLSARLDHANIVQVHDLGSADGFLYIAMQYVEGFDLNELLRLCTRTKTPLPVQYALLIIIEVLRGLDYAHRRTADDGRPLGIVHRDVSPSNILISLEGEVKLCDFGIAHAHDAFGSYSDDVIKGKAGYMSPEQARGDPIDARADVFAVGIVLWELLSGYRLYRTGNDQGVTLLARARAAEIPPLPPRGLPLETELYAFLDKALARNREERHPSTQAMLRDLLQYVAESKQIASPLRFREWLLERFGERLTEQRLARECAIKALEAHEAGLADGSSAARAVGAAAVESTAELTPGAEASAHRMQEVSAEIPASFPLVHKSSPRQNAPARGEAAGANSAEGPRSPAPLVRARPPRNVGLRFAGFAIIALVVYFIVSHC